MSRRHFCVDFQVTLHINGQILTLYFLCDSGPVTCGFVQLRPAIFRRHDRCRNITRTNSKCTCSQRFRDTFIQTRTNMLDHQVLHFHGSGKTALLLRTICAIALIFGIGTWRASGAWAQSATPPAVTFQAVQGGANPPSQTVRVSKSNSRPTSWTASDSARWLSVSPASGSMTSSTQVVLGVNIAGLAAGTYTGSAVVSMNRGGSVSIPVTLKVVTSGGGSPPPPPPPPPGNSSASLTWNAVTSQNLAGYKVYFGKASGVYGTPVDVGKVTSYVVGNLTKGTTYYFAVTSYNGSGTESTPSNEVSKSIY